MFPPTPFNQFLLCSVCGWSKGSCVLPWVLSDLWSSLSLRAILDLAYLVGVCHGKSDLWVNKTNTSSLSFKVVLFRWKKGKKESKYLFISRVLSCTETLLYSLGHSTGRRQGWETGYALDDGRTNESEMGRIIQHSTHNDRHSHTTNKGHTQSPINSTNRLFLCPPFKSSFEGELHKHSAC